MTKHHDKFINVITVEVPEGSIYGYISLEQYWDDQEPEAFKRAEELAATGQPVVVKSGHRGIRTESVRWQSFNSKNRPALLDR